MKKLTLTLLVILGLSMAVNAQTYVGTMESLYLFGLPGLFTSNGHSNVLHVKEGSIKPYCFSIYENDFSTKVFDYEVTIEELNDIMCYYINLSSADNTDSYESKANWLLFTQSLFNTDDNYEFIEQFDEGWNIKSVDGTIIQTINLEDGCSVSHFPIVFNLDEIFYLGLPEYSFSKDRQQMLIFRIDQSAGLTKVDVELPITVFPSLADKNQQITVELGESNNAKEITVVNGLGQVIKRIPVEEGQRQITIPAKEMNSGLNVVNTRTEQGQGSCKIIVQ